MADKKISALTGATTPLAGTEVLPIVQGGSTVKVAVSDLTAGRAVGANGLTSTANIRVQYSAAGNVSSVANNTSSSAGSMSQLITTNDASRSLRVQYSASGGAGGSALTNGISTETAQVFTDGNYPIVFGTNVSAALILDTSQNAKIINNLVIGTAGKGIDFSANGGDVLSQYDEGTWTPVATGIVVNSGTPVWSGTYTRIGRTVVLQWALTGGANINTTLSSYLSIPFTALGNSWGNYGNVATNTHIGGIVTYGALLYFGTVAAGISSASGTITIQI